MVPQDRAHNSGSRAKIEDDTRRYTLDVFPIGNTIKATLYNKLGNDPAKDFESSGLIAKIPNLLVVNPSLLFTT